MAEYSQVYFENDDKHFGYRYNFTDGVLECTIQDQSKKYYNWEIAFCIRLNEKKWNENPQHWVNFYAKAYAEELAGVFVVSLGV